MRFAYHLPMNTMPGISGKQMGQRIKALRMAKGWTQIEASIQLGISLRSVVALENNHSRRFRPLTLARIAMAMESIQKAA